MSAHPNSAPETDPEQLHPFRVEGKVAVQALLRDLMSRRALVALYAAGNHEESAVSQVLRYDDRHIDLDFITDGPLCQRMLAAPRVTVIGTLDTIKVQFDVTGLAETRTPQGSVLRSALPGVAYRLQRRDAFRVRPLVTDPLTCHVRTGLDREHAFRVFDFSALGIAFGLPPGIALPKPRDLLQHCRLEFGSSRRVIPCDLLVRNVSAGGSDPGAARRIGCEFHRLAPDAAREIQLAVMEVEKKGRPLRA